MFLAHLNNTTPATTTAPTAPVKPAAPRVAAPVKVSAAPEPSTELTTIPPVIAETIRIESIETLAPLDTRKHSAHVAGDFVYETQPIDPVFRHVSAIWTAKAQNPDDSEVMTYDDALELLARESAKTRDVTIPIGQLAPVIDGHGFRVTDRKTGQTFALSENAQNQISSRCGLPVTLARSLPGFNPEQRAAVQSLVSASLDTIADKSAFVRFSGDSVRAILSEKYAAVNHLWLLEQYSAMLPDALVSHFRASDGFDSIRFNLLIPDSLRAESDSDYGGMLSIGNSETGNRKVSQMPSVFRAICMNGCIWDQREGTALVQIHRGEIDLDVLRRGMWENLNRQIPMLNDGISAMLDLQSLTTNVEALPVFGAVLRSLRLPVITKSHADQVFGAYAGQRIDSARVTAFDIVQSFTRAAQDCSVELQGTIEGAAGDMVFWGADRWRTVFKSAESLRQDELKSLFKSALAS